MKSPPRSAISSSPNASSGTTLRRALGPPPPGCDDNHDQPAGSRPLPSMPAAYVATDGLLGPQKVHGAQLRHGTGPAGRETPLPGSPLSAARPPTSNGLRDSVLDGELRRRAHRRPRSARPRSRPMLALSHHSPNRQGRPRSGLHDHRPTRVERSPSAHTADPSPSIVAELRPYVFRTVAVPLPPFAPPTFTFTPVFSNMEMSLKGRS